MRRGVLSSAQVSWFDRVCLTAHVLQQEKEELCVPSVLLCIVDAFGGYTYSDDVEGAHRWEKTCSSNPRATPLRLMSSTMAHDINAAETLTTPTTFNGGSDETTVLNSSPFLRPSPPSVSKSTHDGNYQNLATGIGFWRRPSLATRITRIAKSVENSHRDGHLGIYRNQSPGVPFPCGQVSQKPVWPFRSKCRVTSATPPPQSHQRLGFFSFLYFFIVASMISRINHVFTCEVRCAEKHVRATRCSVFSSRRVRDIR